MNSAAATKEFPIANAPAMLAWTLARRGSLICASIVRAALQTLASFVIFVLSIVAAGIAVAAPPAPVPLAPGNGANVLVPFTISWAAVADPSGAAIAAYNWKVSPSAGMTPVVLMDSTGGTTTQDAVSGLLPGAYFWQVQAASSGGQSAWSPVQSFNVTGVGPGTPGTPVLGPTRGYSTFHPMESVHFSWSAVAGAPTYRVEVSNDPNFPLGTVPAGVQTFWNDNARTTTDGYVHHPSLGEGTWFARVFATDSDFAGGIRSLPSNTIQYTVFYNNPIGPAPQLLSPINGETLTLPVTLTWAHVPNPQAMGYLWQVAKDSTFSNIEFSNNQYTEPLALFEHLSSGPKFWRVLSQHGLSSPTTNANTAWSSTGRFTISSAPPAPMSIGLQGAAPPYVVYSGAAGRAVKVQLSAVAPPGGSTLTLTSSHPALLPVPATVTVPAGFGATAFEVQIGQAIQPTPVTLSATLNAATATGQITVMPPTLNDDPLQPGPMVVTGGASTTGLVDLEGLGTAPAGGVVVSLSTNSAMVTVPSAVTIAAGARGAGFTIQTSPVTTATTVTITASHSATTTQWTIKLMPSAAPTSFVVSPTSTTSGAQGTVGIGQSAGFDQTMQVTSSNPAVAAVPAFATITAGNVAGFFNIVTSPVTAPTAVTISVSGGGVTLSAPLTVHPVLPALTALTVSPTSVVGGDAATGTVRLASAAPMGGVGVNLASNLPLAASVPASVTVPAGATTANFTVTTFPSALTTVQLSAALNNQFQFAAITVNPPPPATPPTRHRRNRSPSTGATWPTRRATRSRSTTPRPSPHPSGRTRSSASRRRPWSACPRNACGGVCVHRIRPACSVRSPPHGASHRRLLRQRRACPPCP